jgi:hypothetical protein
MAVEAAGVGQEEVLPPPEEGVDTAAATTTVVEDEQQVQASQQTKAKEQGQLEVAPFQQFYAIRSCYSLKAPAVFLNYDDCSLYIEQDENDETLEYKRFDIMAEAMEYIYEYITAPTRQYAAAGASTTVATTSAAATNTNAAGNTIALTNNAASNALPEPILAATKTTTSTHAPDDASNTVDNTEEGAGKMPNLQQPPEATTTVDLSAGATTTAASAFPMMISPTPMMPNVNFQNMFYWTQPMPQFGFTPFPPMPPGWVPPPVAMYQPSPPTAKAPLKSKAKKKAGVSGHGGPMESKANSDTAESAATKKRGRVKKRKADDDDDDDNDDEGSTLETSSPSKKKARKETKLVKMFEEKYELLKHYKEQYGTCDVPFNNKNTASGKFAGLGAWVSRMRLKMRAFLDEPDAVTSLDKTKVQRLLDLGFAMTPHRWSKPHTISSKDEFNWDEMFDDLKAFKKKYGHVNVPHRPALDGTEEEKKKLQDLRGWGMYECNGGHSLFVLLFDCTPSYCARNEKRSQFCPCYVLQWFANAATVKNCERASLVT